ncbi:unnamed protein product, partial [Cuscuta epithymum]
MNTYKATSVASESYRSHHHPLLPLSFSHQSHVPPKMDNFVREEFADFGHDQDDILDDEQEVIFDTDDSDCEISTDDENQQGSENEDNIQIPATDHNFRRI